MMNEALFPLAYLLRPERVEKNIRTFIQTLTGASPETSYSSFKVQFLQAAHQQCQVPRIILDDTLTILFGRDEVFDFFTSLLRREDCDVRRNEMLNSPYTEVERVLVCENIQKALYYIQKTMPDLFQSLYYFISRIYVFPSQTLISGSKSNCFGVILMCPTDLNDFTFYVENIIHEALHQLIFLDDALHKIYADPIFFGETSLEPRAVGALTLRPRLFNEALESLIISAAIQYLHILTNNIQQADLLAEKYIVALDKLNTFIAHFESQDKPPLTKNGYFWHQALNSIDWEKIQELSPASQTELISA